MEWVEAHRDCQEPWSCLPALPLTWINPVTQPTVPLSPAHPQGLKSEGRAPRW